MKRALLGLSILAVVGVLAVAVYLYLQLDYIAKRALESHGSDVLQTKVEVDTVKLSPASGVGELRGLRIGNPAGFRSPHVAVVDLIEIELDPKTIAQEVVFIKRITVVAPKLSYEESVKGNNLQVLQRNIARSVGASSADKRRKETKLIVEKLTIRGARVSYVPQLQVRGASLSFALPDISLMNLGKNRGGVTAEELAKAVADTLLTRTVAALGRNAAEQGIQRLLR